MGRMQLMLEATDRQLHDMGKAHNPRSINSVRDGAAAAAGTAATVGAAGLGVHPDWTSGLIQTIQSQHQVQSAQDIVHAGLGAQGSVAEHLLGNVADLTGRAARVGLFGNGAAQHGRRPTGNSLHAVGGSTRAAGAAGSSGSSLIAAGMGPAALAAGQAGQRPVLAGPDASSSAVVQSSPAASVPTASVAALADFISQLPAEVLAGLAGYTQIGHPASYHYGAAVGRAAGEHNHGSDHNQDMVLPGQVCGSSGDGAGQGRASGVREGAAIRRSQVASEPEQE